MLNHEQSFNYSVFVLLNKKKEKSPELQFRNWYAQSFSSISKTRKAHSIAKNSFLFMKND